MGNPGSSCWLLPLQAAAGWWAVILSSASAPTASTTRSRSTHGRRLLKWSRLSRAWWARHWTTGRAREARPPVTNPSSPTARRSSRPAASHQPPVVHASRITRTQQGEQRLRTSLDLRYVRPCPTTGFRLAGSVNGKTGAHARILEADLALPAYPIGQLVGDLPDPAPASRRRAHRRARNGHRPVQADRPARVLRAARRDRRPTRRARALPRARGPDPVLLGRSRREPGVAVPRRRDAGHGARSTTSRRCCSAGRGARSCEATRSSAPAPT